MILVVSKDKDFAAQVSGLVAQELSCACDGIESIDTLRIQGAYQLLVTDAEKPDRNLPLVQLKKPCYVPDLLAEIDRKLQAARKDKPVALSDRYLLFVQDRQLVDIATGKDIRLTDKETALLAYLHGAGEDGMKRQKLLEEVWGIEDGVPTRTLETHIYRLRSKIKSLAVTIELEDGRYRLAL